VSDPVALLGAEQAAWLVREVAASKAIDIDPRTGVFTASLRDVYGKILWTKDIHPAH
jgi:hypothetical protein